MARGTTVAETISPANQSLDCGSDCTGVYGSRITGRFLLGMKFITKTIIEQIISSTTWSCWLEPSTRAIMRSIAGCLPWANLTQSKRLKPGMRVPQGPSGTKPTTNRTCEQEPPNGVTPYCARSAVVSSIPRGSWHPVPSIAPGAAKPLRCVSVENAGSEAVYCMTVPGPRVFALANGVFVSNCWDEVRYSLTSRHKLMEEPKKKEEGPRPGSFDWLTQYGGEVRQKSVYRSV